MGINPSIQFAKFRVKFEDGFGPWQWRAFGIAYSRKGIERILIRENEYEKGFVELQLKMPRPKNVPAHLWAREVMQARGAANEYRRAEKAILKQMKEATGSKKPNPKALYNQWRKKNPPTEYDNCKDYYADDCADYDRAGEVDIFKKIRLEHEETKRIRDSWLMRGLASKHYCKARNPFHQTLHDITKERPGLSSTEITRIARRSYHYQEHDLYDIVNSSLKDLARAGKTEIKDGKWYATNRPCPHKDTPDGTETQKAWEKANEEKLGCLTEKELEEMRHKNRIFFKSEARLRRLVEPALKKLELQNPKEEMTGNATGQVESQATNTLLQTKKDAKMCVEELVKEHLDNDEKPTKQQIEETTMHMTWAILKTCLAQMKDEKRKSKTPN